MGAAPAPAAASDADRRVLEPPPRQRLAWGGEGGGDALFQRRRSATAGATEVDVAHGGRRGGGRVEAPVRAAALGPATEEARYEIRV